MLQFKTLISIVFLVSLLSCSNTKPEILEVVMFYNDANFIPFSGSGEEWIRNGDTCVISNPKILEILSKDKLPYLIRQDTPSLNYVDVVCDIYWDNQRVDKLLVNYFAIEYQGQLSSHDKELADLLFESCGLESKYDYVRGLYNW